MIFDFQQKTKQQTTTKPTKAGGFFFGINKKGRANHGFHGLPLKIALPDFYFPDI